MSKKSTNFTGKKPIKGRHVLDLMAWVGMTDAEIKAALEKQKRGPFASFRDMVYTECPCGCGFKGVCDAQRERVRIADNELPF